MGKSFSTFYPQKWVQIAILIGFCITLYFLNLGQWDLWSPDEPRYAQVTKEMVDRGDWILMHYNGRIYVDKPPLFFWVIGLSSFLWGGFTSFSVRFPSALFGTLTVLLTFFLGRKLFSSRTGFFSSLILSTGVEFAYLSIRANIDTTLTFFTTTSLFCFFKWYREYFLDFSPLPRGERDGARGGLWIYGFYGGMAFGTLTKGPIGFLLPLFTVLVYLAVQREWKAIKEMRLLLGMILFLVIVLSWYLPAVWTGGESYLRETLFTHSLNRFATEWAHARPIYYYLYVFPQSFLPWVIFLPSAVVYAWSKEVVKKRKEVLFLLTWFLVIFIFFSLSKGKRTLYLLPLYPAVSLLIGKFWDDFISDPSGTFKKGWGSLPLSGLIGLLFFLGATIVLSFWIKGNLWTKIPDPVFHRLPVISIGLLLVGCSLILFILFRLRYYGALFIVLVGIMGGGLFYTSRVVFPLVNPYKSARFLSKEITSRIQPGDKIGIYGRISTAPHNFFTGVVPIIALNTPKDLLEFLRSSDRVFCLLTFDKFYTLQSQEKELKIHVIARRQVGDQDCVLISNR